MERQCWTRYLEFVANSFLVDPNAKTDGLDPQVAGRESPLVFLPDLRHAAGLP
jgi:hypothetical protein